jgi:fatty-acyl-CoA synthase
MQPQPLLISSIIRFAARHHPRTEVVSREPDGTLVRTTYTALEQRARRLAQVLCHLGVQPSERVATLAWSNLRHLELYYAVSGMGAICHTLNPRLPPEQIAGIAHHAGDTLLFVDPGLAPLLATLAPLVEGCVRNVVVMAPAGQMPAVALPPAMRLLCYEALMDAADAEFDWPQFDENTASGLCYTSGTTGRPKGVLYSHRSTVLHAMAMNGADVLGLRARDRILPAVQMFHVNAAGVPFAAPLAGAALLLPGRWLDGASLLALLDAERATVGWGVPTVWLGLLRHLEQTGARPATLRRIAIGGAACPRHLSERMRLYGVEVQHNWGMTESSPLGTYNQPTSAHDGLDADASLDLACKQGRALFGVDLKIVDPAERELPWDGLAAGRLMIRGPWVIQRYFGEAAPDAAGQDGWFDTGDVASIDADGFVLIVDRAKDMIKSGGEWISSVMLEDMARAHPAVADAAAIAVPHPQWQERPVLIVVARPGHAPDPDAVRAFLAGRLRRWTVPDAIIVIEELPLTGTGKVDKRTLRARFAATLTEHGKQG